MHGVRKGIQRGVTCPSGKGMCFTSWDAAQAALVRLGAERVYRCSQCGYMHVTRYTEAEYSQRVADTDLEGCTTVAEYDMVVPTTDRGGDHEAEGQEATADGRQPGDDAGRPGATTFQRGPASRPPPSPAEVARFLEGRRGS